MEIKRQMRWIDNNNSYYANGFINSYSIYLGTGSSFDIKKLLPEIDYTKLTSDNFVVGAVSGNYKNTSTLHRGTEKDSYAAISGFTIGKIYNSNTGILTLSGLSQTLTDYRLGEYPVQNAATQSLTGLAVYIAS